MEPNAKPDRIATLLGLLFLAGFWAAKIVLQMAVISVLYYYVIAKALSVPTIPVTKLIVMLCACYATKYAFIPPDVKKVNTNITVFLKEILTILIILCALSALSKLI